MPDLVLTEIDAGAGLATLALNRPEQRNPTSIAMLEAMDRGLDAIEEAGEAVRVMILAGNGPAFCAGLDLDEVLGDETTIRTLLRRLSEVMRRVRRLPIVTIARVQGAAIGGGFGLMAAADFAVTHPESKIGYPPLETCLSPALMAPWLIRKIGPSAARAMLLRGGTISGQAAHEAGLATDLVSRAALPDTARALAEELARGGRFATRAMKELLNDLDDSRADAALDRAAEVSADVIAHPESQTRLRERLGGRTGPRS